MKYILLGAAALALSGCAANRPVPYESLPKTDVYDGIPVVCDLAIRNVSACEMNVIEQDMQWKKPRLESDQANFASVLNEREFLRKSVQMDGVAATRQLCLSKVIPEMLSLMERTAREMQSDPYGSQLGCNNAIRFVQRAVQDDQAREGKWPDDSRQPQAMR